MLGIREPDIYGKKDYHFLENMIISFAKKNNLEIEIYQSNHEGDLVDKIQEAYFKKIDGIVFNPGAYTHTSIALLDALKAVGIPCVEVHISDVDSREEFRKTSFISLACVKTIKGHDLEGYIEAIKFLMGQ